MMSCRLSTNDLLPLALEVLIDLVHECLSAEVVCSLGDFVAMSADSEILCHMSLLDGVNNSTLESGGELGEELVVVELCSVSETSCPCED